MTLQNIFDELCKGNLSILSLEAYEYIADIIKRATVNPKQYENEIKILCMIGNIIYNRTDMTANPIEDSVYDWLMELYKKMDPNFQVGAAVVQFQSQIENTMKDRGIVGPIDPLNFYEAQERDEVRQYYADQLLSFDNGRYTHDEAFGEKSPIEDIGLLKKGLHDTKHNHPTLVGTLDKVKFVLDSDAIEKDVYDKPNTQILERDFFMEHIRTGIISPNEELEMVLELKYDGVSVEADCTNIVNSARTRGDTGVGEAVDITQLLHGYNLPKNDTLKDRNVGVKFEAIMSYSDLQTFNQIRGKNYANARTAIIGLFGASDSYKFRDFITLIPLALDRDDVPEVKNRMEEIELLNKLYSSKGESLRYCYIKGDYQTCLFLIKKFVEEAQYARNYLNFMFDGIVVSYLNEDIRNKLGRKNFINKFSIAVKFDPLSRYTTFLGYTFNVGQTGNICPMIHYSPVEFLGTIHDKSSGASLNRFNNLALKFGDTIEVTYNNDVMPYVSKVDCEHNRQNTNPLVEFPTACPCCGTPLEISKSGESARCPNFRCPDRQVARLTATLDKLGIKGFAEESVRKIMVTHLSELSKLTKEVMIMSLGNTNGEKLYNALQELQKIPFPIERAFGSIGFTGLGIETWKKIFTAIPVDKFIEIITGANSNEIINYISAIKGLGLSTARTIVEEWKFFKDDIDYILHMNLKQLNNNIKGKVRFTGCRDSELEAILQERGYDANGSAGVTKDTDYLIVPYKGFSSTKTDKVSEDCKILTLAEVKENLSKILL